VTPRTLQWRPNAPVWLDVAAFEELIALGAETDAAAGIAALRDAVELYRGDLLEGCYDEWIIGERERLRQHYLLSLERLAELTAACGDHAQAVTYAERLLRQDPLREEIYRLLMRLYDARGDRARALRAYHVCSATLERELGVEPSEETRETYEALLALEGVAQGDARQLRRVSGPPLVGRTAERARLAACWRASQAGRAQLVLVSGEPGIGKTRLVDEFRSWCEHRGAATADGRSYRAEGTLAYGPIVSWLRSEALRERLVRLDRAHRSELGRLLPELLSDSPDNARLPLLPEQDRRQRLFDAVVRVLLAPAGPLLLVANDLQWCDHETLQFLHYLLRVGSDARLLVVGTARLEEIDEQHPLNVLIGSLRAMERFDEIELGGLTVEETAILAESLVRNPLNHRDTEQLHHETEGNPLFVVEALRAGWLRGHAERGRLSPRVQAVIESRLAQLSLPARELGGIAATIGREFTSDLLAQASDANEDELVQGLDELWRRRIIREQAADSYDFSHDRLREVAYQSLGPASRRHYHRRVAQALEQLHAGDPAPVSGQLAAHYEQAGAVEQAVGWYERAADAAQQLQAHREAVRLLDRALALLFSLPDSPQWRARELAILTALTGPLVAIEAYRSPRVIELHERALALAKRLGTEPAPPLLRSVALASVSRDDFVGAAQFGEQLRLSGERDADDVRVVEGHYILGIDAFWQGELEVARRHFESVAERYRPEHQRAHIVLYGQDPLVICLMRLGCTLWLLGCPAAARQARDRALAWAEQSGHPYSLQVALVFALALALDMREQQRMRDYALLLTTRDADAAASQIEIAVEFFGAFLDAVDGRAADGVRRLQSVLVDPRWVEQPAPGNRALALHVLMEICAIAGDARSGLAAAEQALETAVSAGPWEAEARRLRAEFLAALGARTEDVDAELLCALDVARRQGARLLQLRAAASLYRWRLERSDERGAREAHDMLRTVYDEFTDGHDTVDVREAAELLVASVRNT
jgi:tetratricopeptide (TPR) repeat protein